MRDTTVRYKVGDHLTFTINEEDQLFGDVLNIDEGYVSVRWHNGQAGVFPDNYDAYGRIKITSDEDEIPL